ncbi:hypothetical protein AB0C29_12240 [Actinoplanes sp. NPDC048791]|uniref:hypothetical protein n=1 Tax=Actinoplanes sp. NPDC048791 TaxID=3154623 RepID=UPI0033D65E34
MRITASSFACPQRNVGSTTGAGTMVWARDCAKNPARYGATDREAAIVADLLAQAEREGTR